ncbi:hypothetical protein PoB_005248100 [Plakobranchus ocellatus]|uniref:Uncharacterized protein n=1 Tax=Plakobranchus ocellatus TaxID=259542 RepID=A0AAV4BRW3_9GAST|nr:hypothetical protein PoB_005248100 [Plakobranchus ocellatus]
MWKQEGLGPRVEKAVICIDFQCSYCTYGWTRVRETGKQTKYLRTTWMAYSVETGDRRLLNANRNSNVNVVSKYEEIKNASAPNLKIAEDNNCLERQRLRYPVAFATY